MTSLPGAREGESSPGTPHNEEAAWRGEGTCQMSQGWPRARQGGQQGFSAGGMLGQAASTATGRGEASGEPCPICSLPKMPTPCVRSENKPKAVLFSVAQNQGL